jgi:hypothetical protein
MQNDELTHMDTSIIMITLYFERIISMVGDKAWNQWNHGTSAKPWNEC